jgi:hypothetical protein
VFSTKFVGHGSRWGNTAQALNRWWHPVASSEALDVLHQMMCHASYRRTRMGMAVEIDSDSPAFFVAVDSLFAHNLS